MKHPLFTLVTVLCLSSPALVSAEPLDCPNPSAVFTEAGGGTFDLAALAQKVGTAELDGDNLSTIAQELAKAHPDATKADIADIMITAFCNYLNTDAPANHRSEAFVTNFENQVSIAVYGADKPAD
ncbi:hypothetical protein [Phaeobacter sp. HF9A]|uniref:hypothetical protein n=1 Tax=Phaeobacter sp. HF9A TaxID=2721561 RepID=UPI00142FF847|nr:hypothetical protein [Phaeobacter sp. HF9A]NIZ11986.1 hypothetical protein [Phaeobacter sp. HF9A]